MSEMTTAAALLAELEKSALAGDPSARLVMEHPITGLLLKELVETPIPTYVRFDVPHNKLILKDGTRRIIHGYASVEIIDKQNELVTIPALKKAWERLKKAGEKYANINLEHSNITVGKILLDETVKATDGKDYWSHVDDKGLYIVAELRDDIEIADKIWEMSNRGDLNAYSIGGRALKKRVVQKGAKTFWQIDDLELYEVTVCKRGKNTLSGFEVLKSYLDNGIIDQEMFLQKSAELKKSETMVKELAFLPSFIGKSLVLRKDFVCQIGSSVEKGQGRDFDVLVKLEVDNPLRRHIETRILKALPPELWDTFEFVFGDEGGPHDTFRPLYDLALVPTQPARVEMTKGDKTARSNDQSSRTLKNVVDGKTAEDDAMSAEEKKAIGTPGLTGTGTGPQEGAVAGTSTEGPAIASLKARVKKLEEELAKAKPKKDEEEEEKAKPKDDEEEKKAAKKPDEDEEGEKAGKKYPYPDEEKGEVDPEVMTALEGLEAKGKLPEGLRRWMAERKKKKAKKAEERMASIETRMETIEKNIGAILKAVKPKKDEEEEKAKPKDDEEEKKGDVKKSDAAGMSQDEVNRVAEKTAEILKGQAVAVRKAEATPGVSPDAGTEKPLTLQDLHKMNWQEVDALEAKRKAAFLQARS